MKHEQTLVCLVGISGVGKSTVAAQLRDHFDYSLLASYTTRAPRDGDFPGELEYVSDGTYDFLDKHGYYLEKAVHGSARYALKRPEPDGKLFVTPINAHGVKYLADTQDEHRMRLVTVGILPPSIEALERRNAHLHPQSWVARRQRDHHFGYTSPPPLMDGREYDLALVNGHLVNTVFIIANYVNETIYA